MADEKEKTMEKEHEAVKPGEGEQHELSDLDLGKAVGGAVNAYLYVE